MFLFITRFTKAKREDYLLAIAMRVLQKSVTQQKLIYREIMIFFVVSNAVFNNKVHVNKLYTNKYVNTYECIRKKISGVKLSD